MNSFRINMSIWTKWTNSCKKIKSICFRNLRWRILRDHRPLWALVVLPLVVVLVAQLLKQSKLRVISTNLPLKSQKIMHTLSIILLRLNSLLTKTKTLFKNRSSRNLKTFGSTCNLTVWILPMHTTVIKRTRIKTFVMKFCKAHKISNNSMWMPSNSKII